MQPQKRKSKKNAYYKETTKERAQVEAAIDIYN